MQQNLFQALTDGGMLSQRGEITLLILPRGHGGLVAFSEDFLPARRWAEAHVGTLNASRNIELFSDHLEYFISRRGTSVATKGHIQRLIRLARVMQSGGIDLEDWNVSKEIVEGLRPEDPFAQKPPTAVAGNNETGED